VTGLRKQPNSDIIADQVSAKLDAEIARVRDTNDRDQSYFHPSTVGQCPRQTVLERLEIPKSVPHDVRIQRIFENGHGVHARIQKELRDAGILVLDEVALEAPEYNMKGHTDGIGRLYVDGLGGVLVVLEIKSCSEKSWKWMTGNGRLASHGPDRKHIWQVQLYMYMTGLNYAVILYENKNDQSRAYYTIKRDAELIKDVLLPRVYVVNQSVNERTLPPRDPEHQIVGDKVPFECQYCAYRNLCEEEERRFEFAGNRPIDLVALASELSGAAVPSSPLPTN
jgi:hypothetical protein